MCIKKRKYGTHVQKCEPASGNIVWIINFTWGYLSTYCYEVPSGVTKYFRSCLLSLTHFSPTCLSIIFCFPINYSVFFLFLTPRKGRHVEVILNFRKFTFEVPDFFLVVTSLFQLNKSLIFFCVPDINNECHVARM